MTQTLPVDVIIFGGGAAGLWLLDELTRAGYGTLLLEAHELGSGQTIASQGIIHGGLKYTLSGLFTSSAKSIREMPLIWRRCLAGESTPDLRGVRLRAEYCHLWQTESLRSRLAMIGARAGLRVSPVKLEAVERPAALADCPGVVARLDEQVIDPISFIAELNNQHGRKILRIDYQHGLEFVPDESGGVRLVRLINPETGDPLDLRPGVVIFAAGAGNAELRRTAGLSDDMMQRRPLHMVIVRSRDHRLPVLNGHCVDGRSTRLTITTTRDYNDYRIWQIGGQIAEKGVTLDPAELIELAQTELRAVLPGLDLKGLEWATYRADRAEAATRHGARPDDTFVYQEGNIITAWPTKLALVPELTKKVMRTIKAAKPQAVDVGFSELITRWPRPVIALPPWETMDQWHVGD